MAAAYFLRKGYQHFAVLEAMDHRYAQDRMTGFERELAKAGMKNVLRLKPPIPDVWDTLSPSLPAAAAGKNRF